MSGGLYHLDNEDFLIKTGQKGNILCHNIPGFSLILFYSNNCNHCHNLIPIFKRLPGSISGCQFGMVNVMKNRQTVIMSQSTIIPIKYVPFIVLYFNGSPFIVYDREPDENEIKRFIIDVSNNIQKKQQFSSNQNANKDKPGGQVSEPVPEFLKGIGVPFCSDKVCYLTNLNAYGDKKPGMK